MCSAMPRRIAVIGSTVSPGSVSPAATGAGAAGFAGAGGVSAGGAACGAAGCAGAAGAASCCCCAPPDSTNARMSFFVTRPPEPVPGTWDGSIPCSAGDAGHDGRDEGLAVARRRRSGRGGSRRRRGLGCRRCGSLGLGRFLGGRRKRLGLGRRSGGSSLRGGAAAERCSSDLAELRADVDRLALLDEDLRQRSGRWARHLGVDLVGRDLEQRLVGLDLLAFLLEPPGERPLRDGNAHLRHHDVDCGLRGHAAPS